MRSWDCHCPECGSDTIDLLSVHHMSDTLDRLRKRCRACHHAWSEETVRHVVPRKDNGYYPTVGDAVKAKAR